MLTTGVDERGCGWNDAPLGQTAEEAVADLREALDGWFAEFGVPDELRITVRDVG